MNDPSVILDLWRSSLIVAAELATPMLVAALAVGLLTSLLQAATQMQENVLSFVPKLIAVGLVLLLAGGWLLDRAGTYTKRTIGSIAEIGAESRQ